VAKNTKCLDCLSVFMNSYEMSFCAGCGQDKAYLVEFDTETPKHPTRLEIALAKIAELEKVITELQKENQDVF
jgi:hypothetical protein